ncbi:MAG: hypothetical protein Q4G60_02185 [bacterium]|nr:hypothetical protein [bacterium]
MKLKYYLRGVGIGIIVTALIMGIALGSKRELTDTEIKERAAKLGMVEESDVLLPTATVEPSGQDQAAPDDAAGTSGQDQAAPDDAAVSPEPKVTEINPENESERNAAATRIAAQVSAKIKSDAMIRESEDEVGVAGGTSKPEQTAGNADAAEAADNAQTETTDTESQTDTAAREPIVIFVESGNGSDTVSKKLVDAGLVENAESFDKYLCNRDYDYRITIGKHTIPAGSTYDEIAHILISAAE